MAIVCCSQLLRVVAKTVPGTCQRDRGRLPGTGCQRDHPHGTCQRDRRQGGRCRCGRHQVGTAHWNSRHSRRKMARVSETMDTNPLWRRNAGWCQVSRVHGANRQHGTCVLRSDASVEQKQGVTVKMIEMHNTGVWTLGIEEAQSGDEDNYIKMLIPAQRRLNTFPSAASHFTDRTCLRNAMVQLPAGHSVEEGNKAFKLNLWRHACGTSMQEAVLVSCGGCPAAGAESDGRIVPAIWRPGMSCVSCAVRGLPGSDKGSE